MQLHLHLYLNIFYIRWPLCTAHHTLILQAEYLLLHTAPRVAHKIYRAKSTLIYGVIRGRVCYQEAFYVIYSFLWQAQVSEEEGKHALSSRLQINSYVYVALWDPGCMKFSHIIEQSPRNWETTMCPNVALTVFHTQNMYHHVW